MNKILQLSISILILTIFTSNANAFDYNNNKPLIYIYKTNNGWTGAGPIQFLLTSFKSKSETLGHVYNVSYGRKKDITRDLNYLATYGKCIVYEGNFKLNSWDKSPKTIIKWMKKYCH